MKYFVTGATGFIGARLVERLLRGGHDVVALVRNVKRAEKLQRIGAKLAEGDVTDKETLRVPMSGADALFHVAGWYKIGLRDESPARRINVDGTRNVLEMMRELGVRKGVYTSTIAVFSDTHGALVDESYRFNGRHLSEYDRTKWAAQYEIAEPMMRAGLPLIIVQPGAVYGPGDTSPIGENLRQYIRKRLPAVPRGTAFCWGYIDDIVEGHILAMEKGRPGESYIIAGPPHTFVEALEESERICGIKAPRIHLGPAVMKTMAVLTSIVGSVISLPESYMPETLRVSAGVTYLGSNAKARRELGFAPRSLSEGLRPTLEALMKESGR